MMESTTILEMNPTIFMEQFINAVENGYYVANTNAGHISDGILKEIVLYKQEDKVFDPIPLGELTVMDYNSQAFLNQICHAVAQGAKFDLKTLVWDSQGMKIVKGTMYLKGRYNKAELAELDWDSLKDACKELGFSGRDRNLLTMKYLQATGQAQ